LVSAQGLIWEQTLVPVLALALALVLAPLFA
jgi:hypothetical protein